MVAGKAEELGFASFWVPEHPVIPLQTSSPYPGSRDGIIPDAYGRIMDPFVALARASARVMRPRENVRRLPWN